MSTVDIIKLAKVAPDVNITVRAGDLVAFAHNLVAMSRVEFLNNRAIYASPDEIVDRETALSMLGVKCRQTLNRWDRIGYLKPVKVGGVNHWRLADIVAIINKRNNTSTIQNI